MTRQGVLLVVGKKGSGKTNLVREFLNEQDRYIAVDVMGEFGGVVIEEPHSLVAWLNRNRQLARWRLSYRDRGFSDVPPADVFKALQSLRDCWLALDEASLWRFVPQAEWFFAFGRHNNISVAATVQRAHQIGPVMRSQVDVIVSFRQSEPRDLAWISEVAGEDKAREVSELGEFEWTYVVCEHEEIQATLDRISEDEGGGETDARLDSATVEPGALDGGPARVVGAPEGGEGRQDAGPGAEGSGRSRVARESGPPAPAGEARGDRDSDGPREGQASDSSSSRRGGRRKARKVISTA